MKKILSFTFMIGFVFLVLSGFSFAKTDKDSGDDGGIFVYDNNGVPLGYSLGFLDYYSLSVLTFQNYLLGVDRNSGTSRFSGQSYYTTSDCSGEMYVEYTPPGWPSLKGFIFTVYGVNELFYVPRDAEVETIICYSGGYPGTCSVRTTPMEKEVYKALPNDPNVTGISNDYPFAAPFDVRH